MSLLDRLFGKRAGPSAKTTESRPSNESMDGVAARVKKATELGWFKFVPEDLLAEGQAQLEDNLRRHRLVSTNHTDDDRGTFDGREYFADAEDLAEGGIGNLLTEMAEVLAMEGVEFAEVVDEIDDRHYDLIIDGKRFTIYDCVGEPWQLWTTALRRALEIVNELLAGARSNERVYAKYGGNDALVILMTPELHAFIASFESDRREIPRAPSDFDAD